MFLELQIKVQAIMDKILTDLFVEITPSEAQNVDGAQIINGEWYAPIYDCDNLGHIFDLLQGQEKQRNEHPGSSNAETQVPAGSPRSKRKRPVRKG